MGNKFDDYLKDVLKNANVSQKAQLREYLSGLNSSINKNGNIIEEVAKLNSKQQAQFQRGLREMAATFKQTSTDESQKLLEIEAENEARDAEQRKQHEENYADMAKIEEEVYKYINKAHVQLDSYVVHKQNFEKAAQGKPTAISQGLYPEWTKEAFQALLRRLNEEEKKAGMEQKVAAAMERTADAQTDTAEAQRKAAETEQDAAGKPPSLKESQAEIQEEATAYEEERAAKADEHKSRTEEQIEHERLRVERETLKAQVDAEKQKAKASKWDAVKAFAKSGKPSENHPTSGLILFGLIWHYLFKGFIFKYDPAMSIWMDIVIAIVLWIYWSQIMNPETLSDPKGIPARLVGGFFPPAMIIFLSYFMIPYILVFYPAFPTTAVGSLITRPVFWPWWALLGTIKNPNAKLARYVQIGWIMMLVVPLMISLVTDSPITATAFENVDAIRDAQTQADENKQQGYWSYFWQNTIRCVGGSNDHCMLMGQSPNQKTLECVDKNDNPCDPEERDDCICPDDPISNLKNKEFGYEDLTLAVMSAAVTQGDSVQSVTAYIYGENIEVFPGCRLKKTSQEGRVNKASLKFRQTESGIVTEHTVYCNIKDLDLQKGTNQIVFEVETHNRETRSESNMYIITDDAWIAEQSRPDNKGAVDAYQREIKKIRESTTLQGAARKAAQDKAKENLFKGMFPNVLEPVAFEHGDTFAIATVRSVAPIHITLGKDEYEIEIGVENRRRDGKIMNVNSIELDVPNYLTVDPNHCPLLGNTLVGGLGRNIYKLDSEQLQKTDFSIVKAGTSNQKKLPSCTFTVDDLAGLKDKLGDPTSVNKDQIKVVMNYDYMIEATARVTVAEGDSIRYDWNMPIIAKTGEQQFIKEQAVKWGVDASVAQGLAYWESGGKYAEVGCIPDGDGTSCGTMMIYQKAHPSCYEEDYTSNTDCTIIDGCDPCGGPICSQSGATVQNNWQCNIEAGLRLLKKCYNTHSGSLTVCGRNYKGWDAALRCYNGLRPDCDNLQQLAYVDNVNNAARNLATT